jgi:hypothetical protein
MHAVCIDNILFFEELEKNIILDANYYNEFIILDCNSNRLIDKEEHQVYLIKNNSTVFLVKQFKEDYYYEIERDYIVSTISRHVIAVSSSIKKFSDQSALVMKFYQDVNFNGHLDFEMQIANEFLKSTECEQQGLTQRHLDISQADVRYSFLLAIDTFFCNTDRHPKNLLFGKDNTIILIDHGDCFRYVSLGEEIIKFLAVKKINKQEDISLLLYLDFIRFFNNFIKEEQISFLWSAFFEKYISYKIKTECMPLHIILKNIKIHYNFINIICNNNY